MKRKGFTIIELMMVIGIIGILLGIVTTASSSAIKMSRVRKAESLCNLVKAGLSTYYAQKEKWPVDFNNAGMNNEGYNGTTDYDIHVLTASEVRECVKALVMATKEGSPVMDVSGLFVSDLPGENDGRPAYGLDFMEAIKGTKNHKNRIRVNQMYFGYPEKEHGWFRRFKMTYSVPGDYISVMQQ